MQTLDKTTIKISEAQKATYFFKFFWSLTSMTSKGYRNISASQPSQLRILLVLIHFPTIIVPRNSTFNSRLSPGDAGICCYGVQTKSLKYDFFNPSRSVDEYASFYLPKAHFSYVAKSLSYLSTSLIFSLIV